MSESKKEEKLCVLGLWVVSFLPEAIPEEMSLWQYFGPLYKWQHVVLWRCGVETPQTKNGSQTMPRCCGGVQ